MNVHDSEKMAGLLLGEGYTITETLHEADLILFNTCSIRQKAEQKFMSELGRTKSLKRKNPLLKIAVAGCIAQQQGGKIIKKNPQVDYVLGPQNLHKLRDMIRADKTVVAIEDNPEIVNSDMPISRQEGVRAWVSIMYGCDNYCSYCVVPFTRGRERSRTSDSICREIIGLASNGFKEVTLLGQNVNSYKSDVDFTGLLKKTNDIKGIDRIRFVTSHPRDLSAELMECLKDLPKVCEHIHLPLQSGSSRILKLMNRGYSYGDYIKKAEGLRGLIPGIAITTDIIAGFPSETDADHDLTIKALRAIEFDGIFAFKFSPRPGTKAAEMTGMVPDTVKAHRLDEILNLQDAITFNKNATLEGTVLEVLTEGISKTDKDKTTGRTRTNKIVNFTGNDSCMGRLVSIRVIKSMRHSLNGKLVI